MSLNEKKKDPQVSQIVDESVVFGIKDALTKMQTESQMFQDQVEEYNQRTNNLIPEQTLAVFGKKLKNDYFHLLIKVVDVLEMVNSNVELVESIHQ